VYFFSSQKRRARPCRRLCVHVLTSLTFSSIPFVPSRVQEQQPNIAAAPFIPAGSIKANATPFVPGKSSPDIHLPSDDDFTLGLTGAPMTLGTAPQNPYHLEHTNVASKKVGGGQQSSLLHREPIYPQSPSGMSGQMPVFARFASEQLHAEMKHKSFLEQAQMDPTSEGATDLPRVLNHYHSLVPLEDINRGDVSLVLGLRSDAMKGVSSIDGAAHVLRRIDHNHLVPNSELIAAAKEAVDRWAPFRGHPHVAALCGTFMSADMRDTPALYFAHTYHSGASTLEATHCGDSAGCVPASEAELWNYASQLCCTLRAVHDAGLAVGGAIALSPTKIIRCPCAASAFSTAGTGMASRIRLSAIGVADVLRPDLVGLVTSNGRGVGLAQKDDLRAVGNLLALLACGQTQSRMADPIASARRRCSHPLWHLISGLASGAISDTATFTQLVAPVVLASLEAERAANDRLESELAKELENGRLLRLLIKLGFVNERPDGDMDTEWAETGDRYILKLFRDYVFHQHNNQGSPVMDWGHVFESLNKLDVGVSERVLLLSRDEMSMLVASYADIKRCVDGAYTELLRSSKTNN
jgi:PAB-dependent poly(A)-specific ribonuclease subunit 3